MFEIPCPGLVIQGGGKNWCDYWLSRHSDCVMPMLWVSLMAVWQMTSCNRIKLAAKRDRVGFLSLAVEMWGKFLLVRAWHWGAYAELEILYADAESCFPRETILTL